MIVSDDAGQFRVGTHALCWVHAERLLHKLMPAAPGQVKHVETRRELVWHFYKALKAYRRRPDPRAARGLQARFDRIFSLRTGYGDLDKLLLRLGRRKDELLRVLERPETPLHTNASERDLRGLVIKRKISGGTVSRNGRQARDSMLGLMKTCQSSACRSGTISAIGWGSMTKITLLHPSPRWLQHAPERSRPFGHPALGQIC
uniref:IS66 family transposase n=1 Tax=Rhizobium laguerreae TaxID=1076926 RepID=UPI0028C468E5|nr:transposase [Rhizobium laguerreae]